MRISTILSRITYYIVIISIVVQMSVTVDISSSAATYVATPTASVKSGTHYTEMCEHTVDNPGYHYYYTIGEPKNTQSVDVLKDETKCYGMHNSLSVSLSTSTKGATIYFDAEYTNDTTSWMEGFRTSKGLKYSKPIELTQDTKITAYAVKNGVRSESVTYTYRICPRIKLSHESGTYDEAFSIKVTNPDGTPLSCVVHYTTDGSKPTEDSPETISRGGGYFNITHGYIDITESCTLRLLVVPGKGQTSYYLTKKYTIKNSGSSVIDPKGYENKYYYNTLNERQQKAYASVYKEASLGFNGGLGGFGLKAGEGEEVKDAFFYENPEFPIKIMGWGAGSIFTENSTTQQKKLKEAAEPIIEEAEKLKTDYEKVKYFHDTIITTATYGTTANSQTAYGALVDKKVVCQGYANAFTYLCQSVGIDCIMVGGSATNSLGVNALHTWNMVKVDGNWYHVDTTWDDPTGANTLRYTYFLVSDAQIKKNHFIDMEVSVPSAPKNYGKTTTTTNTNKNETTVSSKAISSKLMSGQLDLAKGSKIKLSYLFTKSEDVKYTVGNKRIAKIVKTKSGAKYVKGIAEGETTITAEYKGDKVSINVLVVEITDENKKFSLPASKTAYIGNTVKITANMDSVTDEYLTWVANPKYLQREYTSGDNSRTIRL